MIDTQGFNGWTAERDSFDDGTDTVVDRAARTVVGTDVTVMRIPGREAEVMLGSDPYSVQGVRDLSLVLWEAARLAER